MKKLLVVSAVALMLVGCTDTSNDEYLLNDELDEALDAVEMLEAM